MVTKVLRISKLSCVQLARTVIIIPVTTFSLESQSNDDLHCRNL